MPQLPPLECLRFFEAAARHESFARASEELGVTPAGVSYRVKMLEEHLGHPLFERLGRSGIRLNKGGQAYLSDVRRILADLAAATDVHRGREGTRSIRVVSVESLAEKWLMPKLGRFEANHRDIAVEIETHHRGVDPQSRDFDVWLAYSGPTAAPRPEPLPGEDALIEDTLWEEALEPVCSPALIEVRGRPHTPADLHRWPLLYDLGWLADWPSWFACQGVAAPDLSRASGYRLYSMVVHAAVEGLGAAIGRPGVIARELREGSLIPIFERRTGIPARCCLITNSAQARPAVETFREWVIKEAGQAARSASAGTES